MLCALLAIGGCRHGQEHLQRAQFGRFVQPQAATLTVDEMDRLDELCPYGTPQALTWWDHGPTELVVREGYALEHSARYKIPLWVCERFEPRQLDGRFTREDHFLPDDKLSGPKAAIKDYRGSGYARGHHAPAEDAAWHEQRLADTFYLSNMSPQVNRFNSGIWRALETRVRELARDGRGTWIITGVLLYDPAEDDPELADGWIPYRTIGADVAVPTHLYKIVVRKNANGRRVAVGFVVPNKKPRKDYHLADFRQPIRWIEERAGHDFMPDLDADEADALEEVLGPVLFP